MRIVFCEEVLKVFGELPERSKRKAAGVLDLLIRFPRMFTVRRKVILRGYRCFEVDQSLFYYEFNSKEIRLVGILPGMMRRA